MTDRRKRRGLLLLAVVLLCVALISMTPLSAADSNSAADPFTRVDVTSRYQPTRQPLP